MLEKFSNEKIFVKNIPEYDNEQITPIEKDYYNVIAINTVITFLIFTVAYFISLNAFEFLRKIEFKLLLTVCYFVFWFFLFIYGWYAFKKRGYCFREHDVIYKFGLFEETVVLIPFNRIQHIALHQGIFSRIYGLASLQFYTAGGSTTDINIKGFKLEDAKKFKEFVSNKIEKIKSK